MITLNIKKKTEQQNNRTTEQQKKRTTEQPWETHLLLSVTSQTKK